MFSQLYYHNEKAYILKRKIPITHFNIKGKIELEYVKGWRDWLGCDHVLRDTTHYLFVNNIQDIEFEEISNNLIKL
jgi:hypothetical protein